MSFFAPIAIGAKNFLNQRSNIYDLPIIIGISMKKEKHINMKKTYKKSEVKKIAIDNEISLVIMSSKGTPFGKPF